LVIAAASGCAHAPVATVLPQQGGRYEVVAQSSSEQGAYKKAQDEATYTCEEHDRRLVVLNQSSVYQGANKDARGEVDGGNVALALFTGSSGKERQSDDYKVTLLIECAS
jgi:hypothetical protein